MDKLLAIRQIMVQKMLKKTQTQLKIPLDTMTQMSPVHVIVT